MAHYDDANKFFAKSHARNFSVLESDKNFRMKIQCGESKALEQPAYIVFHAKHRQKPASLLMIFLKADIFSSRSRTNLSQRVMFLRGTEIVIHHKMRLLVNIMRGRSS